jgi:FKBP-type peptidyl-prolyl cis-trans isomerase SlyD
MGTTQQWRSVCTAVAVLGILLAAASVRAADNNLAVADGLQVTIEYSLSLKDKTPIGSNVGKEPFTYIQGDNTILPGLEKALVGMKAGQKKHVELAAADAYGPYDEKARTSVPKDKVPEGVKVGAMLSAPGGRPVKVLEVNDKEVVLDLNHPLAGKDIVFDVTVLKVAKPEKKAAPEKSDAPAPKAD